jgi:hypothetical protein
MRFLRSSFTLSSARLPSTLLLTISGRMVQSRRSDELQWRADVPPALCVTAGSLAKPECQECRSNVLVP